MNFLEKINWPYVAIGALSAAFVSLLIIHLTTEPEPAVKYVPEEVDLSAFNSKIQSLETNMAHKDTVIWELTAIIKKSRANEKGSISDQMGIDRLDDAGVDARVRRNISIADSLIRAGHSWYDPWH